MKLGADAVIAKPFDDDRLHAAIQDLPPQTPAREPLAHARRPLRAARPHGFIVANKAREDTMTDPISRPGLLLVMMDIDPARESEFNRWYEEEHIRERLSIPGFVRARRFVAVEGGPKYLALYELTGPEVLQSEEYLRWRNEGATEWTRRMEAEFKGFVRNVYVELSSAEAEAS